MQSMFVQHWHSPTSNFQFAEGWHVDISTVSCVPLATATAANHLSVCVCRWHDCTPQPSVGHCNMHSGRKAHKNHSTATRGKPTGCVFLHTLLPSATWQRRTQSEEQSGHNGSARAPTAYRFFDLDNRRGILFVGFPVGWHPGQISAQRLTREKPAESVRAGTEPRKLNGGY